MSDRIGVAKVYLLEDGCRGIISNSSKRGLWEIKEGIESELFEPFYRGTILNVTLTVSDSGEKTVGKVEIAKESLIRSPRSMTGAEFIAEATGKPLEGSDVVWDDRDVPEVVAPVEVDKSVVEWSVKVPVTWMGAKDSVALSAASNQVDEVAARVAEKEPAALDGFYIDSDARLVFSTAKQLSDAQPRKAVKLMMVGPSGYGKTTLPRLFAEATGKSFMRMNCATIRDPEEWFGYREARGGDTVFIRSELVKALEAGNLVLVLDEFNRLEPWLHNTLYPMLDDDGATVVHGEEFRIGEGVVVVGTINTGYRYTGTFELDEALLNRFEFVLEVGPLPRAEEANVLRARTGLELGRAREVVRVATILRELEVACSTRTTLAICNLIVSGMTLREAYEWAVVRRIPTDSASSGLRKQVTDRLNSAVGILEQRKLSYDVFQTEVLPVATEEAPAEQSSETPTYVLFRRKSMTGSWLRVQIIQQLRSIPHTKEFPDGFLTLRYAQELVKRIEDGETVLLELLENSEELGLVMESLGKYGIDASFS